MAYVLNRNDKYGDFCIRIKSDLPKLPEHCIIRSQKKNLINFDISIQDKLKLLTNPPEPESTNILLEYSCPNTNKPQHIGHLRNNLIGESMKRILRYQGNTVTAVNLVNDRGVHICKSMLAYMRDPEYYDELSTTMKGDHLVGQCYVDYHKKEDPKAAQSLLKQWEDGDPETIALWKKMNKWVIEGFRQTYDLYHIEFDEWQYESALYKVGRDIIRSHDCFKQSSDGSYYIPLEDINIPPSTNKDGTINDKKTVLRSDGTSIYITQDIGVMQSRISEFNPDKIVQVVADEQNYYFKVLFGITKLLNKSGPETKHLSYGMIKLVDGVIKSRIGRTVDIDNLYNDTKKLILSQHSNDWDEAGISAIERDHRSNKLALASIKYFILSIKPSKSFVFNPTNSIKFTGKTGPYIMYAYARIHSIFDTVDQKPDMSKISLLSTKYENAVVNELFNCRLLAVPQAAANYDPSLICKALYHLCKASHAMYHAPDHKLHKANNTELVCARLVLYKLVLDTIYDISTLLGIDLLATM